jgi:hypothetical protein
MLARLQTYHLWMVGREERNNTLTSGRINVVVYHRTCSHRLSRRGADNSSVNLYRRLLSNWTLGIGRWWCGIDWDELCILRQVLASALATKCSFITYLEPRSLLQPGHRLVDYQ